jgi:SAM-dependent methyltransferase
MDADLRINYWEESYKRKENFIVYPKEEVVKFLNRFVKKRNDRSLLPEFSLLENRRLRALDFGCGVGRQTILLSEFDIDVWGGDISENALSFARQMVVEMKPFTKGQISFFKLSGTSLPFENDFFEIGICDSVLDSMWLEIARKIIQELDRVISKKLYISLISSDCQKEQKPIDEIVSTTHEKNTIQSYYDLEKIDRLLANTNWKIEWYNIVTEIVPKNNFKNTRYHIVLKK